VPALLQAFARIVALNVCGCSNADAVLAALLVCVLPRQSFTLRRGLVLIWQHGAFELGLGPRYVVAPVDSLQLIPMSGVHF